MATQDAGLRLQGQPAWTPGGACVCLSRAHWALPRVPPQQPGPSQERSLQRNTLGVEESQHRNAPSL